VFSIQEFFKNEVRITIWFNGSNSFRLSMRIREIDIMPLLMEVISNLHGFMDIVIFIINVISSELDLHTIRFPWPLENS
jgi:hypothetical protein